MDGEPETAGDDAANWAVGGSAFVGEGPEFWHEVSAVCDRISRSLGTSELAPGDRRRQEVARGEDWLKMIYETAHQSLQNDRERGWTILQLFTPLSLAAFLVVPAINELAVGHVLVLGLTSSLLMLAGNMFNYRLSRARRKAVVVINAIEIEIGLPAMSHVSMSKQRFEFRLGHLRWALMAGVSGLWILLAVLVANGVVTGS